MTLAAIDNFHSDRAIKGKTMDQTKRMKDFLDESWGNGPRGWQTPPDQRISKQDAEQLFLEITQSLRDEGITDPRLERVVDRGEVCRTVIHILGS